MSTPRYHTPTVRLTIFGQEHELTTQVRSGPCRPVDLLPLARRTTDAITEVAVRAVTTQGREVSCRSGCASCCRLLVPVAPIEALGIAKLVKAMPGNRREAVRKRFSAAVRKVEEIGLLDRGALPGRTQITADAAGGKTAEEVAGARYFEARIACPLLEGERCMVHEDRPAACRQHLVTTPPERCAKLDEGAEAVARPLAMSEVLSEISASIGDVDPVAMPLVLALEWAEACGVELEGEIDGDEAARDFFVRVAVTLGAGDPTS